MRPTVGIQDRPGPQLACWADLAQAEITAWPRAADLGMTDRTRALLEGGLTRLHMLAKHAAGQPHPGPGIR